MVEAPGGVIAEAAACEAGPLDGMARGPRRVLAMLRTRIVGTTAARVALETGLSVPHTRRCLRRLRADGFVECETASVMWGYRPQRLRLWRPPHR